MLGFLALAQEALARIRDRIFSATVGVSVTLTAGTARAALATGAVATCQVAPQGASETVATASIDAGIS